MRRSSTEHGIMSSGQIPMMTESVQKAGRSRLRSGEAVRTLRGPDLIPNIWRVKNSTMCHKCMKYIIKPDAYSAKGMRRRTQ